MKILTIIGARPQFIKSATVSRLIKLNPSIEEIVIHTGQHYDHKMSKVFFNEMKMDAPKYKLSFGGGSHSEMTGGMMIEIEKIALKEKPDWVMVYGDTNSTLAGALVASKLSIKLAHIESGLRSHNMRMPEEINRIVTDRLSNLLFCPTKNAIKNLESEGFKNFDASIVLSGDIMKTSSIFYSNYAVKPSIEINNEFIISTIHRAENTDNKDNLNNILSALKEIGKKIQVILPIHPRTLKKCNVFGIDLQGIKVVDPVSYLEMIWLLKNCKMVMTDSGGLQKESYFFKKPCVIYRAETEWVELVENNHNNLSGVQKKDIVEAVFNHNFNTDYSVKYYGGKFTDKIIIDNLIKFN